METTGRHRMFLLVLRLIKSAELEGPDLWGNWLEGFAKWFQKVIVRYDFIAEFPVMGLREHCYSPLVRDVM